MTTPNNMVGKTCRASVLHKIIELASGRRKRGFLFPNKWSALAICILAAKDEYEIY